MKIIDLDYNPLRRSISTQNAAARASYLPQSLDSVKTSLDINRRLMDLQDENRAADRQARLVNSIAGLANVGLDVASSIGKIIEQKQVQEAKPMAYQASNEIKAAMREARLNGEFTIEKDPTTGKYVIPETPQRVTEVMNKWKEAGKEKKFWSSARGFLDDSLNQSFYSAVGIATDEAIIQGARDRDAAFMQNVSLATQESISTGSMDPVGSQIMSADWLTDDAKEVLMEQARKDVLFGRTSNELTAIASKDSAQAALTAFEGVKGSFGEEDQKRLRAAMAQADKDAFNLSLSTATDQYTKLTAPETDELGNVTKEGVIRADAIRGIEQTWQGRKADKDAVVAELRKMQDSAEWGDAYSLFNDVRDDLPKLEKAYEDIKSGERSYRFDGIDETHKQVLDMFARQKEYLKAKEAGEQGGKAENLAQEMQKVFGAWEIEVPDPRTGTKNSSQATEARIWQLIDAGGPAATGYGLIGKIRSGNKPMYAPLFSDLAEFYDTQNKSLKDPAQKGDAARRREENMAMLSAMAGKTDTNYESLSKAVQRVKEIEVAKDVQRLLSNGAMERFGRSDLGKFKGMAQAGALDDVVYVDNQGNTRFTQGRNTFDQLMSLSEQMLIEAGAPVKAGTSQFVKQGREDLGADWTTKGSDGKTYAVRSFDGGRTVKPAVLENGEWKDISPAPKPVNDPAVKAVEAAAAVDTSIKNQNIQMIRSITDERQRRTRVQAFLDAGVITLRDLEAAGLDRNGNPKTTPARGGAR